VPIHSGAGTVEQDRTTHAVADGPVDRPAGRRRRRDEDDLTGK
jgi:hypothetical protein